MIDVLQRSAVVGGVYMQLVVMGFSDASVVIVSQLPNPGAWAKITVSVSEGLEPVFNTTPLLAVRDELGWDVCAKRIATAMLAAGRFDAERPLVLSLGLKHFDKDTVSQVAEFVSRSLAEART